MNTDIQNVIMVLRFEIYNEAHHFTPEQRYKLNSILDDVNEIEIDLSITNTVKLLKNIKKIKNILERYEHKFKEFGGNTEKLEEKLKELKLQKIKSASEIISLKR